MPLKKYPKLQYTKVIQILYGNIYNVWNFLVLPFRNNVKNILGFHPCIVVEKEYFRKRITLCPGTSKKQSKKQIHLNVPKGTKQGLKKNTNFLINKKFPIAECRLHEPALVNYLGKAPKNKLDELHSLLTND